MINRKHEVRIDRASVADDIGVSVPTLMKYLRLLVKEGFLINQKVKTRDGLDKYTLLFDPSAFAPPTEPKGTKRPATARSNSDKVNRVDAALKPVASVSDSTKEPKPSADSDASASALSTREEGTEGPATARSESDLLSVSADANSSSTAKTNLQISVPPIGPKPIDPAVVMDLENKEICPDLARVNERFSGNPIREVNRLMEEYPEEADYYNGDEKGHQEEESDEGYNPDTESPAELASFGIAPVMNGVNEEDPYMADLEEFIEDYTIKNKEFFNLAFPDLNQTDQVVKYAYAAYFMQAEDIRTKGVDRVRLFEKIDEYHEVMRNHLARATKLKAIGAYSSHDIGYKEKFQKALGYLAGHRNLNIAPDSITINVDPQMNHLYIKAEEQSFYELFRDYQYQNLGKAMTKACLHSCGYVTFKGPNNGDEFVFQISKNPEA